MNRREAIYALLEKWPWWFPLLDYFRHPFLPRKDERPHTTQELYRVYEDARTAQKLCDLLEPLATRQMNNQRIEARPFFGFKDFSDRNRLELVSSEPVNSFSRQRDQLAFPQQFNRRIAVG